MAVTLNCRQSHSSPFSPAELKKSDFQLHEAFQQKKIDSINTNAALVNHELIDRAQELEDFDQAENLFYAISISAAPVVSRISFASRIGRHPHFGSGVSRDSFGLRSRGAQGEPERLRKRPEETDTEFMMSCASNWLKNF